MDRNACTRASRPLHSAPMSTARIRLLVLTSAIKEAAAPISIMPSSPRFRTPERCVMISPSAVISRGVPWATAAVNVANIITCTMTNPTFLSKQSGNS